MTNFDLGFGFWDLGFPSLLAMAAPSGANPSPWLQFVPFVLVLAIFYFIILLNMKKKQQKVQELLAGLKVNDRVITSGGIFGTVTKVAAVSYTHLRAHETGRNLVCRLLL